MAETVSGQWGVTQTVCEAVSGDRANMYHTELEVGISVHDAFPVTTWLIFQTPSTCLTRETITPPADQIKEQDEQDRVTKLAKKPVSLTF